MEVIEIRKISGTGSHNSRKKKFFLFLLSLLSKIKGTGLIHSDEEYLVVTRIMSIFAPVNIHQRANTYINMANDKNYIQPTASTSDVTMTLDQLADRILFVDETFRQQAAHAVNCMLTARN